MLTNLDGKGLENNTSFQQISKECRVPEEDRETSTILQPHKRGDNPDCSDYMGVTLLDVVYKRFPIKKWKSFT